MNALRNSIQLIGNLGKDIELKKFENGNSLVNFPLATNEQFINAEGEVVQNTQWHTITAWGKKAESMAKVLTKGSQVLIQGKISYKSYEAKDGSKRYSTEILANNFMSLTPKA